MGVVYENLFRGCLTFFESLYGLSLGWIEGFDFGRTDGLGRFHLIREVPLKHSFAHLFLLAVDPMVLVLKRLVGWKGSHLSKGGKVVLIKSVLFSLPTYFLSFLVIPALVEKILEQCQREFLWGKNKEGQGMNLMAWSKVCKPKAYGGLGIRRIRTTNKTLLSKWLWRFGRERENLWRQVIASKYGSVSDWEAKSSMHPYGCGCWKAIMKETTNFKQRIKFEVGSGRRIRF